MDIRTHVKRGIELFNKHDLDIVTLYSPDAVEVTPLGTFTGRDEIAERYRSLWTAFPDLHLEPFSWTVEGDTVVVEYTATGTHTGPLSAPDGTKVPATGRRVQFPHSSTFQVRDGQTVSHRLYYDLMQVMTQLGLVGAPA